MPLYTFIFLRIIIIIMVLLELLERVYRYTHAHSHRYPPSHSHTHTHTLTHSHTHTFTPSHSQGTHKSLRGDQNAKATVTAIIDGTGSLGAAFGPLLIGFITDRHHTVSQKSWNIAFYVLMASCFLSAVVSMPHSKERKREV